MAMLLMFCWEPGPGEWAPWVLREGKGYGGSCVAVMCGEILGQKETSPLWEGFWHGCNLPSAAAAYGEGQARCSQPGKGGGC